MSRANQPRENHAEDSVNMQDALESIRRGFPLRLDRNGRFWIGDEAVTHLRIIACLRRGLDLTDSGEAIVRLQDQWTYLRVEDCLLQATHVQAQFSSESDLPVNFLLDLDDQRRIIMDPYCLWAESEGSLRCTAPAQNSSHRLSVRFNNHAQIELASFLVEDSTSKHIFLKMSPKSVDLSQQSKHFQAQGFPVSTES